MTGSAAVRAFDLDAYFERIAYVGDRAPSRVTLDALHGRDPRYVDWLDVVKVPTKVV